MMYSVISVTMIPKKPNINMGDFGISYVGTAVVRNNI
tara:strand:- start:88 stop:198 length:111 start_codon:yes stop_codon:yes gene_type:complete